MLLFFIMFRCIYLYENYICIGHEKNKLSLKSKNVYRYKTVYNIDVYVMIFKFDKIMTHCSDIAHTYVLKLENYKLMVL